MQDGSPASLIQQKPFLSALKRAQSWLIVRVVFLTGYFISNHLIHNIVFINRVTSIKWIFLTRLSVFASS